ncbi:MAG: hypothetical protein QOF48_2646 [Verrucomicrobiota bacterium]|jgi:glucose-fructose oxidoreductase
MKKSRTSLRSKKNGTHPIRYAVIGLGHIAQTAVLPAFANARKNSRLTALVSDDPVKLRELSREYGVPHTFSYADYEACLRSGEIDAVYIALPNNLHRDFAVRAANAGVHVLCEKPLALDEKECEDVIRACAVNGVHVMTAYRLHFERANLEAVELIRAGKIGTPRIFNSLFTMQIRPGNIRLQKHSGGGTLYDLGIYCINAARYLFQEEPTEVFAFASQNTDPRFSEVDEMTSALLRFPEEKLASFTSSFGAADRANFEVVGTKGTVRLSNGYEHSESITMEWTVKGRTRTREYPKRDQFAPELIYFSDCIHSDRPPEPSGIEGMLDVHIIRSLLESIREGVPVELRQLSRRQRPGRRQVIYRPPAARHRQVHVEAPSR